MNDLRPLTIITAFLIMTFSTAANALEHWYLPMQPELKTIKVFNKDSQPHTVWISKPIDVYQDPMEDSFTVPAFGNLEVPLIPYLQSSWIHIKSQDPGILQVQVLTADESPFFIKSGSQTKWWTRARAASQLVISNLAPFSQVIKIQSQSTSQELTLLAFETKRLSTDSFSMASTIYIEGSAHIAGVVIAQHASQGLSPDLKPAVLEPPANPATRYFLVTNSSASQSFSMAVSDPTILASIDQQLADPKSYLGRILIAEIDFTSGDQNRDFVNPSASPWSWHVSHAIRFAQLASQSCDGSPEYLEEVLNPWKNSTSAICFWNYRVSRELTLKELQTGKFQIAP